MNLAILISGSGTTMEAVITAIKEGRLTNINPAIVVSSDSTAGGLEKAKKLGIKSIIVERKKYSSQEEFGNALLDIFHSNNVDFISQNGWHPLMPKNVIDKFLNKIINQHPGPLDPGYPDFGGKNMYGLRVTCARLGYIALVHADLWTESVIHYVNEKYDKGKLIQIKPLGIRDAFFVNDINGLRKKSDILKKHSEEIQKKLFPLEYENVIEVLQEFANGKNPIYERKHRLIREENFSQLEEAKKLAIELFT